MKILISELKEYPWNSNVYGEHTSELQTKEMDELVASIGDKGVLVPPVVDQEGFIIAGNRRVHACKILGIEEIEVQQFQFEDEMQRIVYLFTSNHYRTKTTEIKTREAMYLKTAHKKYAEALRRQKEDPDYVFNDEAFRSLVGSEALKSIMPMPDRTLRKSEKVVAKLDELDAAGKDEQARSLRDVLETNISGAEKIVDDWEKDETKEINAAEANDLDELKTPKKKLDIDPSDYDEDRYWYWKDLHILTKQMRTAVSRLKNHKRYNSTTAIALVWIISNIVKVCEKFETWGPKNVEDCQICRGSGTQVDGTACSFCLGGKSGYYTMPSTDEDGEDNGEDS